ncbi:class I lanthipeptide [Taibaiella helva]|uniref:class I lanthipeptide n=1 Tax=Taibaiella helva TaxID=2301235 RepID=UPI0018E581EA
MKKRKIQKLRLGKETIAHLDQPMTDQVLGGRMADMDAGLAPFPTWDGNCTQGCTDGCSPLQTRWNCSAADCTYNCTDRVPFCRP